MKNLNIQKSVDTNPKQEKNNQKKLERQKVGETSSPQCSIIRATDCNTEK